MAPGRLADRPTKPGSYGTHGPPFASPDDIQQHDSRKHDLCDSKSYEDIAQSLRRVLRDDDVEMEDASDWPASWNEGDQETQEEERVRDVATSAQGNQSRPHQISSLEEDQHVIYIALDTNIFISHLETVQAIHKQLSEADRTDQHYRSDTSSEAVKIKLLVPNVVIHELDKQKEMWRQPATPKSSLIPTSNEIASARSLQASHHAKVAHTPAHHGKSSPTLAAAARAAIEWLLRIRQSQRQGGMNQALGHLWIFQKKGEVLNDNAILSKADDRILDCCEYYQSDIRVFGRKNDVILWTDDKNLSLQAEIHDIACIGNRSYSAEQVIMAARNAGPRSEAQQPPATTARIPAKISPSKHIAPASAHSPHTHHNRNQTPIASKETRSRNRGITSSIWANCPQTSRKQRASGQNGKARASSLPLLTSSSTTRNSTHAGHAHHFDFDPGFSPSALRTQAKVIVPPRLPDAITIFENSTPTPTNVGIALGHILAFPLYDLLLAEVCRGQPTVLREFLGSTDLGPGHWIGLDCVRLLITGWQFGLQTVYSLHYGQSSSITPDICFEAMTWLHSFFFGLATTELQRQDAEIPWESISQRTGVTEALRILFVQYSSQWWLDAEHVSAIERLIDWIRSG